MGFDKFLKFVKSRLFSKSAPFMKIQSILGSAMICLSIVLVCGCNSKEPSNANLKTKLTSPTNVQSRDSIINEHLNHGAWTKGLYSNEWQEEIDKGLAKDSTIAYLWQQKAMPLYKQGKYELGLPFLDKAVMYDPNEYQHYRAFMKCIFAKNYKDAISDFEDCKAKYGNRYVMDHTYNFYIALSKIMLNQYAEAETLLDLETKKVAQDTGDEWVHYLDVFYLGVAQYEQRKYEAAIKSFDKTLVLYPNFSEALYLKGNSLGRLGNKSEAITLMDDAKKYGLKGFTINEDNVRYERYPYQIRWENW